MRENQDRELPVILAEVVPEPTWQPQLPSPSAPPHLRQRRVWLPLFLFLATCLSTVLVQGLPLGLNAVLQLRPLLGPHAAVWEGIRIGLLEGLKYALPLMTILVCHEMGHFVQARRYGVYASYPYFIPMPLSPFGTFGAVIAMEARVGHRRALYDIGITGPLAGLVPTLIFTLIGLQWSHYGAPDPHPAGMQFGEPLLFRWLADWVLGPRPDGMELYVHHMAFAGWVGLFITSLNLIPIGQLDGGHVLYALLRRKAHKVATLLLLGATLVVIWQSFVQRQPSPWLLMVFLLMLMGPVHPPTADDNEPLGFFRYVLGWLTLAFIIVGFTPDPLPLGP